jgi:hypothetical protein
MTYKLIVFDWHGDIHLRSEEAFKRMLALDKAGHGVVRLNEYSQRLRTNVTVLAWIEFDTEEEAAVFKLTHL